MEKHANKIRTAAIVMAVVLVALSIGFSAVSLFSAGQQIKLALSVVLTLARLAMAALVIALVVLAVKRRRQEGKEARAEKTHRRIRAAAIAMVPVMLLLSFVCFLSLIDGARIDFLLHITPMQEKLLARAVGFKLAPGETLGFGCFYEYDAFSEDKVSVEVEGIASMDDFLLRFHSKAALEENYDAEQEKDKLRAFYEEEGARRYILYGNTDFTVTVHRSGRVLIEAKGPASGPAKAVAFTLLLFRIWPVFIMSLPVLVPLGWLSVPALITTLITLRHKSKKE